MAYILSDEILSDVRALITQITHFEGDKFKNLEKCVITTIKKSDTMCFPNTKDIKRAIESMAEKFQFHGFFKHAEYLKSLHEKYIDRDLSESDLMPRLNVVKFLLSLSESPTSQFWRNPADFAFIDFIKTEEEKIDWGAYLNAGIQIDVLNDSSDESDTGSVENQQEEVQTGAASTQTLIPEADKVEIYDFKKCRENLLASIQHSWYNENVVVEEPPSGYFEANIAQLFQKHLRQQTMNLIEIAPITIISEYKIMREIIWQLWGPHNSTIFEFAQNQIQAKSEVTISSMRAMTFKKVLQAFVPYIEVLHYFRCFFRLIDDESVSQTYKRYGFVIREILDGVLGEVLKIEEIIRKQDQTFTLIRMQVEFERIFGPVFTLKKIHEKVVVMGLSPLESSLSLLTKLRKHLDFCLNKLEQDIILTLYIEALYYYFSMVNSWFVKNDLYDSTQEFIILNKSEKNDDFKTHYILQDNIGDFLQEDGVLRIISDQVLQIGCNIHLLRLLGKFDIPSRDSETIHEKFKRLFMEELMKFYNCELEPPKAPETLKQESNFNHLKIGDWTNFVDMSDGFLVKVFEELQNENTEDNSQETLFFRISKTTTNLFPLQDLPEKIFLQILKERFQVSGLVVKNLLIDKFNLDKEFEFLRHIFLFWDDIIFSFYRRLFQKMNIPNSNWGNSIWLTSHFQDILMDLYPNFYENCTVHVKDSWKQCRDSIEACSLINLQYVIKWPLNIIITKTQLENYQEIFHVILKLKWGLYTINHLVFPDIEAKSKSKKLKTSKYVIQKLKFLRFNLINILNSIQHYLFGFVFVKCRVQFELDFEKANDLKSLIASHELFLGDIFKEVMQIKNKDDGGYGFHTLLKSVKMLKIMWNDLSVASIENLESCYKIFKASAEVMNCIVNPVFVYNY